MSHSIISLLVLKDYRIMRPYIMVYWFAGLGAIALAVVISGLLAANFAFTILISAMVGCGYHCLVQTIIEEKVKSTQPFIMSLPLTFRDFSIAKLIFNLSIFGSIWLCLSIACLLVTFGNNLLPMGSLPMMCMAILGILLAYNVVLSVCLISQSQGFFIVSIILTNFGTVCYLWAVVYLEPIGSYVWGSETVWNSTAISILLMQFLAIITLLVITVRVQFHKKEYI